MRKILFTCFLICLVFLGNTQSVTEVLYPSYIQGVGSGSPSNDVKVPYACRMTITGLNPSSTYRYYPSFVDNPTSQSNGTGNYILVNQSGNFTRVTAASLANPGAYGEFTTDGSGNYTGWFISEPTSDIVFTPGTQLYWRIILNNGAGGLVPLHRLTAANAVTVINWGFTNSPLEGSALYNVPNAAWTAKNFVMLYNNIAGTGRPVSGTFIESDGTANTTVEYYDLWYEMFVDGQNNIWGTIIPNNLANGINNISQYALSNGNFVNKCTSPNGVYGATDTRNATTGNDAFGTLLIIDCTPNVGCSVSTSTTVTNILCNGTSTGSIDLTVSGATAPIAYSWSNGASTQDISNVPAGTYTVTITDAIGCVASATATITQPTALNASANAGTIACNGGTTTITVSATGGSSPYTGTGSFTVSAGTYNYTITDANGCTAIASVTVAQPATLQVNAAHGQILCNGGTTTVTVSATGGTAPYSGTGNFTVVAGTYSYTITDARGCTATTQVTITQPTILTAASAAPPIPVVGGSTTITVSAMGGTPPYTGTGDFVRTAGTYTFTITDANGCTATTTITLTDPGCGLALSSNVIPVTCHGASTGAIDLTVTGATNPITYSWSNSAVTEDLAGLPAGNYTVQVTDAVGCIATTTVAVTEPALLSVNINAGTINCNGGTTTVAVVASGGVAPYTGTGNFTVGEGTYSYTVTDANGCTATVSTTISQPPILSANATAGTIDCHGGNTIVVVTANGGTAPYTGTGSFTVNAGTYNYTVTDANGCTATTSVTVAEPVVLAAASTAGTIACHGGTTTITVSATGGTAPYTGAGSFTAGAGTYNYTVIDARGCTATTSITIVEPATLVASASSGLILCNGGTANIIITAIGGTAPYNGIGNFTRGVGTHSFTVTDAAGCTAVTSVTINSQPSTLTATATAPAITHCGGTTLVTVNGNGGTLPYAYPGAGNYIRGPGTWTFEVRDALGCTATAEITIAAPECLGVRPNPVQNTMIIDHSPAADGAIIQLFGINGARMMERKIAVNSIQTTIDMSRFASGNYVLLYLNGNERKKILFVKL